jgi:hypothetical protein
VNQKTARKKYPEDIVRLSVCDRYLEITVQISIHCLRLAIQAIPVIPYAVNSSVLIISSP